ncbi:MAG: class F sortase [Chloroflexota bacterium]|nr:class F sortase [Chloroflexota bacterium]
MLIGLAAVAAAIPSSALADPLTVSLPTLGVEARTEPLAVIDGQLSVPVNPDQIGTYQLRGNLLLVGHVDWAGKTRAFAGLRSFSGGEPIELSDGRTYHVAWVSTVLATDPDLSNVFAVGDDMLTLITCDGAFSLSQHQYLERLTVRAVRDQT